MQHGRPADHLDGAKSESTPGQSESPQELEFSSSSKGPLAFVCDGACRCDWVI